MHGNVPTLIIDPIMLFREGLRRIIYDSGFLSVWCSDRPPVGPIANLAMGVTPLLIIGSEFEEAILQVAEVRRLYASVRPVLLLDGPIQREAFTASNGFIDTFVLRSSSCDIFLNTLKLVLDGLSVVPTDMLGSLLDAKDEQEGIKASLTSSVMRYMASEPGGHQRHGLSDRELNMLAPLQEGLSNKEIARRLGITESTVKVHIKAILRKARLRNRTQIAIWASTLKAEAPRQPETVDG